MEINPRKFCFSYKLQNSYITTHIESIGKFIDSLSAQYENFTLIGDFNATEFDSSVENSVISTVLVGQDPT